MIDRLDPKSDNKPGIVDVAADFGKSLLQGAIINPVWNGLGQLVSAGHLPQISITNAENARSSTVDSWAQKIGGAVGMAADFFVLSKIKSGLAGEAAAETAGTLSLSQRALATAVENAKVGSFYGAVFVPSAPGDNIITGRLKNAVTNGITFGALGGMTEGVSGLPIFGKIMPGTLANTVKDLGVTTAMGLPAGAIGAETDSLLNNGKVASWSSIKDTATDYGVIGFALGAMTHSVNALAARGQVAEPQAARVTEKPTSSNLDLHSTSEVADNARTIVSLDAASNSRDVGIASGITSGIEEEPMSKPSLGSELQTLEAGKVSTSNAADAAEVTKYSSSPVVSKTERNTMAGQITQTVLADNTVIDHHHFDDITVVTKPDGTIITESNSGVRTEYTDGRELNVTSYRTGSRSRDGKWTIRPNKWSKVWENWDEATPGEKLSVLQSLDKIPQRGGNLVANIVEQGFSESDPAMNQLAIDGIKKIYKPEEQWNQWSYAWNYLPQFSGQLLEMMPQLHESVQSRLFSGRGTGSISNLIESMTDHNTRAGDPEGAETAVNTFLQAVQGFPKEARKAIWDRLGMRARGSDLAYENADNRRAAEQVNEAITGGNMAAINAFGEFYVQMRPQFNPLDTVQDSTVTRNDLTVNSSGNAEEKFQQLKAILQEFAATSQESPQTTAALRAHGQAMDRAQSLADQFLADNHQVELQKKVLDWVQSQPDGYMKSFVNWRLSPTKRSVQLTNDFIELAKKDELDTYQFSRAIENPFELARRAEHYHITPEQIMAAKQNVVQLMEIADANRGPDGALTRAGNMFRMAAIQSMSQAADPFAVVQGNHPTCALTQLEFSTYINHPDEATRAVNEVMRTGKFVTQDGSVIEITPGSLKPEDGSLEPTESKYDATPNYRSYASQIFQMLAANIYWQRATTSPDGRTVPAGSLHYELNSTAVPGAQDVIIDYSIKPPRVVGKGPKIVVTFKQLEDIGRQIGGEATKPNVSMTLPGNPTDLEAFLKTIPYPEGFPLIVPVDSSALRDGRIPVGKKFDHAISILAPFIHGNRVYYRNTWSPGDLVQEHMDHGRFSRIAGLAP